MNDRLNLNLYKPLQHKQDLYATQGTICFWEPAGYTREFIEIYVYKELKKFPCGNLLPLLPASTVVTLLNYLNTHNNSLEHKYFHSMLSLTAESCVEFYFVFMVVFGELTSLCINPKVVWNRVFENQKSFLPINTS